MVRHVLPQCQRFPNCAPLKLPLLILKRSFPAKTSATEIEQKFSSNGWDPAWRYSMFPFSHYHSNTHEALAIFAGQALLQFGGDDEVFVQEQVEAGDVILVPAGVAHKQVKASGGFTMVGAYPKGAPQWDCLEGKGGHSEKTAAEDIISKVSLPPADPVYGNAPSAPLCQFWQSSP